MIRNSVVLRAVLVLAGCTASAADDSRILIAGSNMQHPPFSSRDAEGRTVGLEVDIVEEAARELGLAVSWVERPFPQLLAAIENGEIDVAVSTIGITAERKKRVAFSEPYYETQIVALVRDDDSSPKALAALAAARIGADAATTSYPAAARRWPSATLVGKAHEGMSWPRMVQANLIDAFVVDASDQERLEAASGVSLRKIEEPLSAEFFGVAMRLGQDELLAAINRAIEKVLLADTASPSRMR